MPAQPHVVADAGGVAGLDEHRVIASVPWLVGVRAGTAASR